jgi:menaquinol-cytochrome c reductase iron-sulfur subunit
MDNHSVAGSGETETTRRTVLKAAVGVLSALAAVVVGVPAVATLLGRPSRLKKSGLAPVARLSSLPLRQPVNLKYIQVVEQAFVRVPATRDVWAVRMSDSDVRVYSPICPHLGCRYDWNPAAGEFMCPCHGSIFALDGKVLGGPAPRPLDTLPFKVEKGELYVEWQVFEVGVPRKIVIAG